MSCLFDTLGFLLGLPSNHVRQTICDYLEHNKPVIDGISTVDILKMERPNYIETMRKQYTWGGGVELSAACSIWSLCINVEISSENRYIQFVPLSGGYNKTCQIRWTGNHFSPLSCSTME